MLRAGTYRAKAKQWLLAESAQKGTPSVAVEFELLAPEHAGTTLPWDGWLTDNALERTVETLRVLGWKGDDLDNLAGLDTNEVDLVVELEPYEGKDYPKVKWVNKVGGIATKAPMAPEKAKSFAASMKDRIRAMELAGGQRKPKPSRPPEPPPHTDADIPF